MDRKFTITFSMDAATLDKLEKLTRDHGTNRSEMVRRLIDDANGSKVLIDSPVSYETEER